MREKVINLLGIRQRTTLCRTETDKGKLFVVYMEAITEKQEQKIDNAIDLYGEIRYVKDNNTVVTSRNIYFYGEVDIGNDDDLCQIEHFGLVDKDNGSYMYSKFDYDKGIYTVIDEEIKTYPTKDPVEWFMFNYCIIGKPRRIIVYRCLVNRKIRKC